MSEAASVEPLAQGSLADTPLGHLLVYLAQHASTGTLVLSPESATQDGLRYGLRVRDGRVIGATIGADARGLEHALLPLCALNDGVFAFYAGDLLPHDDSVLRGNVDPYRFLAASLEQYARDDLVDAVLQRFSGVCMRLQPNRELDRLCLDADQRVLLDVLRASPATPEELAADAPMDASKARRTLYLLIVTRTIEPFGDTSSRERSRSSSRLESIPIAADPDATASSTSSSAVRRKSSIPATPETRVSQTPPAQATALQPPAVPAMHSKPPPAWKVLVARRVTSMAPAAPSAGVGDDFKPIDKWIRAGDLLQAEKAVDAAVASNYKNARARATKAWILYLKATKAHTKVPREVMDLAKEALANGSDDARAHLVKGLYYKSDGKLPQALVCFRRAAAADPRDIEARREVHLLCKQLGVAE